MKNNNFIPMRNLQLFAEGTAGDGGTAEGQGVTAGAASQQKGVNNPLADVKYGVQEEAAPAAEVQVSPENRSAEFERLIKGEYKDLYDARMQETIRKRLKGTQETVDKFNALTPMLELMAAKYGVKDVSDVEALIKAVEEDDSYFQDEALERGITVEELKRIRAVERENAELRKQMQEKEQKERADKLYSDWIRQEQDVKRIYPGFNMENELQNNDFVKLLRSGVNVQTAYEVIHKDEIIPAAMQITAETVKRSVVNQIASNGARPVENGMSSQSSSLVKSDVSQLSKADRQEIIRRVQRGEKIRF